MHSLTQLLKKYNVAGPRYTSYPTVPAWTKKVSKQDFDQSLSSLKAKEPLSLYFHLPFCEKLCHFCGCMQVITSDHSRSKQYVEVLLKEVDQVLAKTNPHPTVTQIHFGGGTPNFLKPEELSDIMNHVRKNFSVDSDAEIAIEMHPRTSTPEFCDHLKTLGFNRISLGVQDFDPVVQKLINRHQSHEMTVKMLNYLRGLDFDSFNFDLIYGLPGQSEAGWAKTLEQVLALKPNRLAVYSYAHVPWIKPVQRSFQDSDLPTPEMKLQFFEMALQAFSQNGYHSIGMDHFALAEDELSQAIKQGTIHRNFMGYSTRKDAHQIGFGVSAISYVGGNYFQNLKELPKYESAIEKNELATFRGFLLNQEDQIRRDLITQIMCRGLIDIIKFNKKWNLDFFAHFSEEIKNLESLKADDLVALDKKQLRATEFGQLFLRNIAMCFDPYLSDIQNKAKNPTFSKTV